MPKFPKPVTIVIEGPDNSGKSTLARVIQSQFNTRNRPIWVTESPGPQSADELNARARDWVERMAFESNIYVRHPVVSEAIYGPLLRGESRILPEIHDEFYRQKPFIIYCDPLDRGLQGEVLKEHDTQEHQQAKVAQYASLLIAYRTWAVHRAHLIYRIGDETQTRIAHMLFGAGQYAR